MGTREGVEILPKGLDTRPATKKQESLINSISKRLPETKNYPEYSYFELKKTRESATEFLDAVVERNADRTDDIQSLVSYIAERPGVEKLGSHGLFSQTDDMIDLQKTADNIANHEGMVWSHVLSLRREDAERLGYNKAETWKRLLRRNAIAIAKAHNIPPTDLAWYAAFHNTAHHPHVHLVVYSKSGKTYMTKNAWNDLKKTLANDIFRDEQYKLFKDQTSVRNEIKNKANAIIDRINSHPDETYHTEKFIELLPRLKEQLSNYQGKKVYGYLPKSIKKTVNDILIELMKSNPDLEDLYRVWNQINREKLSLYYDSSKDKDIPITENKEFRSLKNAIIKMALMVDTRQSNWWLKDWNEINNERIMSVIAMLINMIVNSSSKKLGNLATQKVDRGTDRKQRQKLKEKKIAQGKKPNDNEEEGSTISM